MRLVAWVKCPGAGPHHLSVSPIRLMLVMSLVMPQKICRIRWTILTGTIIEVDVTDHCSSCWKYKALERGFFYWYVTVKLTEVRLSFNLASMAKEHAVKRQFFATEIAERTEIFWWPLRVLPLVKTERACNKSMFFSVISVISAISVANNNIS